MKNLKSLYNNHEPGIEFQTNSEARKSDGEKSGGEKEHEMRLKTEKLKVLSEILPLELILFVGS
ncbi:MAG: hypothetical protein KAU95_00025 [Candidatus Aenigmarchaeota archaeon]|nr:hypothetical protein [Candidatus Aenigmarchaeota archaeon]